MYDIGGNGRSDAHNSGGHVNNIAHPIYYGMLFVPEAPKTPYSCIFVKLNLEFTFIRLLSVQGLLRLWNSL